MGARPKKSAGEGRSANVRDHPGEGRSANVRDHLGAFVGRVFRSFRANQGVLLAGGVAYYTLLSIVPLLILLLIGLSNFIDEAELMGTLSRYLGMLVPGQT